MLCFRSRVQRSLTHRAHRPGRDLADDCPNVMVDRKPIVYHRLYNKLGYARILIGSHL